MLIATLTPQILAKEAVFTCLNLTGECYVVTVVDANNGDDWARARRGNVPDAPSVRVVWPHGYDVTLDAARQLLEALLAQQLPSVWESLEEARLIRGALAYQCARENFELDLYRRVHL